MLLALFTLPFFMAFLHRLRGGGFVTLPFKLTYWLLLIVTAWLIGTTDVPWWVCLTIGVGYELWCIPAWMEEITASEGAAIPSDQVTSKSWDAKFIKWMGFGSPILSCFMRATLFIVPLVVALCFEGPALPTISFALIAMTFWPAYEIGYGIDPTNQSKWAEPTVGFFWGIAIALYLGLAFYPPSVP